MAARRKLSIKRCLFVGCLLVFILKINNETFLKIPSNYANVISENTTTFNLCDSSVKDLDVLYFKSITCFFTRIRNVLDTHDFRLKSCLT